MPTEDPQGSDIRSFFKSPHICAGYLSSRNNKKIAVRKVSHGLGKNYTIVVWTLYIC